MKGKKRLIALLLSFLMVLSQMSVATFALDTVADENSDQTVEEQAVEETQPEADVKTAAAETEPAATEPAAAETATEPEAAQPAAAEPAKAEPAKAEEKKAEPAKVEAKEEAFDQSQTVDGVTVNVSAAKGVFPAGSKLSVSKVSVPDAVDTSDAEAAYAFDISILANGEKIQPDGNATVSFTTEEVADYDTAVYHMHDGVQEMSVSESGETASVRTSGFSVYAVVFSRSATSSITDTLEVELKPGDEVSLYDIFDALKLAEPGTRDVVSYSYNGTALELTEVGAEPVAPADFTIKLTETASVQQTPEIVNFVIKRTGESPNPPTVDFELDVHINEVTKYEVSFEPNEGVGPEHAYDTQEVVPEGKATKPADPTKDNCIFEGWYEKDAPKAFDFSTPITKDTELYAVYHEHSWFYNKESDVVGKVYCDNADCPYNKGFFIELNAEDVLHVGDATKYIKLVDPSSKEGFPKQYYTVGQIEYYKGTITKEKDFDGKTPVSEATVNSTEGYYTARVKITENSNAEEVDSLFQPFQVVSAGPIAAEGLVYKDGRCVVADDDMSPEGTSAIVLYKHPTTGKYVRREKLLNDGSIPIGETVIDYIVLPNDDYDPDNPEEYQIGYGEVTINIAGRMFTISYDLNGGKLDGQTGVVTTKVEEGTVITLPSPTRSGYKFDYWEGSRYNAGDKYTVTADHTFKAVWKANKKGVDTGDTNDIAGLLALMIASVGALGAIGYRRRKEDQ